MIDTSVFDPVNARLSGVQGLLRPLLKGWASRVNQGGKDAFKEDVESR